ncbi:MAG TPA: dihydrodipicolinate synthase family protein [Clostridia bacterium]|nr:dihydrodipicolinate synthase family protein [Clostridia bacterium]
MVANKGFKGIFPAFYACYDDDGRVSEQRTGAYAQWLMEKGVNGLYVGGSSGECIYQSVEERKTILENVTKAVNGKIPVIAHVAACLTRDSVELAKHAEQCGADAIAAIPPIYFKQPDHAIAAYWNAISDAVSIGFVIYNIPQNAGVALSLPLFREMLKNPKVIGVKNSSPSVLDILTFKMAGGENLTVFNGPDEQYVAGRIMGADGGIGGTYGIMPELFLLAERFFTRGQNALATEIQFAITQIIYGLLGCKGNLYSVAKQILKRKGMNIGEVRLPLAHATRDDDAAIEALIQKIDRTYETFANR